MHQRLCYMPLLLVCLLLLAGCERPINRAAERRVRDALPEVLGPARQYRVHIANSPGRTVAGHLADVIVDGDDVQLSTGLLLDQLHLELKDVDIDMRHDRVRQVREARFTATIGEASLDEFLAGESPEDEPLRKIRVILGDNQVTLAAERVTLGVGVPFQATGPLRIAGPRRIELDPTRLVVIGIPISGKPLQFIKQRFESGIDLSQLPFPVQITGVQTVRGKLILSGTADVAPLLERAPHTFEVKASRQDRRPW